MSFNGEIYEEAAAGANEVSDVFLMIDDIIILEIDHATNVKPGTHSGLETVPDLETRLLG